MTGAVTQACHIREHRAFLAIAFNFLGCCVFPLSHWISVIKSAPILVAFAPPPSLVSTSPQPASDNDERNDDMANKHFSSWLSRTRFPISLLRALWVAVILWYELGTFLYSSLSCPWPSLHGPGRSPHNHHILVVADPQILDRRSYPTRSPAMQLLSQYVVDLNLRKSWRALLWVGKAPDTVIFLGDMMDNGRAKMLEAEYESYYSRFCDTFPVYGIPSYFLPGNHDVDLAEDSSEDAHHRHISHFGPLNQRVLVGNHTLLLVDALGLIEEDTKRMKVSQSFRQWKGQAGGAIEFIKKMQPVIKNERTILFSHVPLFRTDDATCGPSRESGNIHQGGGIHSGYQNMLGHALTDFILQSIRPIIVFSGDDHDFCENLHSSPGFQVPEITVKSMSIAMGIRRPGVQLLTLGSSVNSVDSDVPSMSHKLCLLPDQLAIYLSVYLPLFILSVLIVGVLNAQRLAFTRTSCRLEDAVDKDYDTELPIASRRRSYSPMRTSVPNHVPRQHFSLSWLSTRFPSSRRSNSSCLTKSCSFLRGSVMDMFSIAFLPFGIFLGIAYWTGVLSS